MELHHLICSALLTCSPLAAQDGERALLLVDPGNPESLYVANYYAHARGIPPQNLVYMDPAAPDYTSLTAIQLQGFFGALANSGLEDQVDMVVLPPGDAYLVSAGGLIDDNCFDVSRFTLPMAYGLGRQASDILAGLTVTTANHFSKLSYGGKAFRSDVSWHLGVESGHPDAERYYIPAMLGWTGQNGNTLQEVLDTIDRSVAVDFSEPVGTVYYMETTDSARSSPRHDAYPTAVSNMLSAGGQAQHLLDVLPLGQHDCMGVMTGWASPAISDPSFSLLPGSFADHLTSYAGTFWNNSQTKMSEWIRKGASGTAGTIEEPCNYSGKFPHARTHVIYYKGVTLGEAWFRSVNFKPFQLLFLGDPLTRPFGSPPIVDVPGAPTGPVTGTISLTPVAAGTDQGASVASLELLVDGVRVETIADGGSFTLDTTALTDGWHELRVRAHDNKLWRNVGRWLGSIDVQNLGRSVSLTPASTTGDLGTRFDLAFAATGPAVQEVVLLQGDRVVSSTGSSTGTLSIHGQNLGAGQLSLRAEARFTDGLATRSAPVNLVIAYSGGGGSSGPPAVFSFKKRVLDESPFLLELPASHEDLASAVTIDVLSGPTQATLLGGSGAWRVFEPLPGAAGSDTLTYRASGPGGSSATGTVTIEYYDPDPCPPAQVYCVAAPNSVGSGALVGHQGSTSVSANDLVLTCTGLPPNQFGMFFYGQGQTQIPVSDGFMCVASGHVRFGAFQFDGAGDAAMPVDYGNLPGTNQILAGDTYSAQLWYRDPPGGSAGNNFSDAIELIFCP